MPTQRYSDMLHDAAIKWGHEPMPGRPRIGNAPAYKGRGIVGNPYVEEPIPTVESLEFSRGDIRLTIDLFIHREQWGFSLTLTCNTYGASYGNFLKFCDPHPNRAGALVAARKEVLRRCEQPVADSKPSGYASLIKWLDEISQPKQLSLF